MSKIGILLVEDDCDHGSLLSLALIEGRPHVHLTLIRTGEEFQRRIREQQFDCIVLDFNLPDCKADELLRHLGKQGNKCPVIVISSNKDQSTVVKCVRSGGVDFVSKAEALSGDNLWRRIEYALARQRRAHETRRKIERRTQRLARLAETDPLTGLSNRFSLDRFFRNRREKLDRRGNVSAIMLDIDRFKSINDNCGHPCGDRVLRAIADTLRGCARKKDLACRWGGEEFVVIRPSTSLPEAVCWAEQLREEIERLRIECSGQYVPVTASIGVVNGPSTELSGETISQADQAMYLAKRRGRNRVYTWEMVAFEKALKQLTRIDGQSPELRLREVLERYRIPLGPTQRNHLTIHAEYVSKVALRLGHALGVGAEAMDRLRIAGLCHDIGKLLIPEDVLAKGTALSGEEWALLQRHSSNGAEMIAELGADRKTADYVRYHHTRFDGADVAGEAGGPSMPIEAKILSVADAFVAMTSERPYQPARSFSSAICELRRERGAQFDPDVVNAAHDALPSEAPFRFSLCAT